VYNNPGQRFVPFLIYLADHQSEKNQASQSLNLINIANYLLIRENTNFYKENNLFTHNNPALIKLTDPKEYDLANTIIKSTLNNININDVTDKLSYLDYQLFLAFYNYGDIEMSEKFIKQATFVNPELGHYHVELANFYLTQKKLTQANDAIKFCFNFQHPKNQCEAFLSNIQANNTEEVGFTKTIFQAKYQPFQPY
jgi:hypothetical protein